MLIYSRHASVSFRPLRRSSADPRRTAVGPLMGNRNSNINLKRRRDTLSIMAVV